MTSFAAPDGWDGACTAANPIPEDQLCDGEPCVQSLTIAAPSVTTGACTPRLDAPPPVPRLDPWATRARACLAGAYTACEDATTCVPAAPSGFLTCVYHEGDDASCPEGYAVRHVFFEDVIDGRECTPCGCGNPTGASCTLMASVYRDAACTDLLASSLVSSSVPFCVVTPPGVALGSKSAAIVDVEPGTCAPHGGEPVGELSRRARHRPSAAWPDWLPPGSPLARAHCTAALAVRRRIAPAAHRGSRAVNVVPRPTLKGHELQLQTPLQVCALLSMANLIELGGATHVALDGLTTERLLQLGATHVVCASDRLVIGPSRPDALEHARARRAWWDSTEEWDKLYSSDVTGSPPSPCGCRRAFTSG